MKRTSNLRIALFILTIAFGLESCAQVSETDLQQLVGVWKLDMSPQDTTDENFARMEITSVTANSMEGEFYRRTVKMREGRINTQLGIIYGALISGDNSGEYYSTFYLKDGVLHGTTHARDRGFLAVWTAKKEK
ncbi:MAG: hypothetical protein AAFP76_11820 [Bacteroidota bacterium]